MGNARSRFCVQRRVTVVRVTQRDSFTFNTGGLLHITQVEVLRTMHSGSSTYNAVWQFYEYYRVEVLLTTQSASLSVKQPGSVTCFVLNR